MYSSSVELAVSIVLWLSVLVLVFRGYSVFLPHSSSMQVWLPDDSKWAKYDGTMV